MASLNLYKKFTSADLENTGGGYKNTVLFAPVETFTALQMPSATPVALGDTLAITTDHTFPVDEGFISMLCKLHAVTLTGDTVGDDGANEVEWKSVFTILGDGASTQEQITGQLNRDSIWLLKDSDCLAGGPYVQLGNECVAPSVSVAFDGKTTKEGKKEYTVTLTCKKKYFYSGAITEKP